MDVMGVADPKGTPKHTSQLVWPKMTETLYDTQSVILDLPEDILRRAQWVMMK